MAGGENNQEGNSIDIGNNTGDNSEFIITIILVLVGCFANALSLILMKFSIEKVERDHRQLMQEAEADGRDPKEIKAQSSVMNKWWISGFIFIVIGTLANIGAVKFGNLLLLASTSALTLIFSAVLSIKILGESYQKSDILAMLLICVGSIASMMVAKTSTEEFTAKEITDLFTSNASIGYIGFAIIYMSCAYIFHFNIKNRVKQNWIEMYETYKTVMLGSQNSDEEKEGGSYSSVKKQSNSQNQDQDQDEGMSFTLHEKKESAKKSTDNYLEMKSEDLVSDQQSSISHKTIKVEMLKNNMEREIEKTPEKKVTPQIVHEFESNPVKRQSLTRQENILPEINDEELSVKLLITIMANLTAQQRKYSSELTRSLAGRARLPLIITSAGAGLLGSLSMSFIKGATESLKTEGAFSIYFIGFIVIAIANGILQLTTLNLSMELYDQVDTIPIYQSSIILLQITAGALIMKESKLYEFWEFINLVVCGIIAIIGVFVIVKKPNFGGLKEGEIPENLSHKQQNNADTQEDLQKPQKHEYCPECFGKCQLENIVIEKQIGKFKKMSQQDQKDLKSLCSVFSKVISHNYHSELKLQELQELHQVESVNK